MPDGRHKVQGKTAGIESEPTVFGM